MALANFNTPNYGKVTISNAMFDEGSTLEEGIEIKGDEIGLIEVYGYYDVDELSIKRIESLIEKNS